MPTVSANNKRIAKNTLMLYIRMIIVMLVTLYTSRVVLHILGSQDYGINNVVGGIVTMLTFMSHTLTHAAQRFFSIELGRGNHERLERVFKVNLTLYTAIAIAVIIIGETVGMWFMHTYLTIPPDRMVAAEWVLHMAILSFCLSMQVLPFRAAIMARENMTILAYISIVEAAAKLGLVFALPYIPIDKLISYALLNFAVHLIINGFYMGFAHVKYPECKYGLSFDKEIMKEITGFTGWTILGHFAIMTRSQGINMLLNVYCGPVVNAARAIAFQVNSAVSHLYTNFFMAVKPQIIKYYSVDNRKEMYKLVTRSSRLCFFLVLLLSIPILTETDYILSLWLKEVPEYTASFVRFILLNTMVESLMPGLTVSLDATGKVRRYQVTVSIIILLSIPIGWWLLAHGYPPYYPMMFIVFLSIIRFFAQLVITKQQLGFTVSGFMKDVMIPVLAVSILAPVIPVLISLKMEEGFLRFVIVLFSSLLLTASLVWLLGMEKNEKLAIRHYVMQKIFRKKHVA